MSTPDTDLSAWVGRSETLHDTITSTPVKAMSAMLDHPPGVVATAMQAEIRDTAPNDFPEVASFQSLHDDGVLREPTAVAREVWALLDRDLPNGSILDLRDA